MTVCRVTRLHLPASDSVHCDGRRPTLQTATVADRRYRLRRSQTDATDCDRRDKRQRLLLTLPAHHTLQIAALDHDDHQVVAAAREVARNHPFRTQAMTTISRLNGSRARVSARARVSRPVPSVQFLFLGLIAKELESTRGTHRASSNGKTPPISHARDLRTARRRSRDPSRRLAIPRQVQQENPPGSATAGRGCRRCRTLG
jgi:hypothetical protein